MKLKPLLFPLLALTFCYTSAQVSIFRADNFNLNPSRIVESKRIPGEFQILYSALNRQGVLIYRNGAIVGNSAADAQANAEVQSVGMLEIGTNDFLVYGTNKQRTGNTTASILRMRTDRLQWAKGFALCDDFSNIGFIADAVQRDSSIYAIGSSRNTGCGVINLDFSVLKIDLQGNIQSQASFAPAGNFSTEGMFFMQPHQNRFYFGGFSTRFACGPGNPQRPGIGWFDSSLNSRRWWAFDGLDFVLNGAMYQAHPVPSNPNRLVCNVRFSPDECADTPVGMGIFVLDSVANPISSIRFRTSNTNDLLACRYSHLVPSDESLLMLGRITSNGTTRDFLLRTTPSGRIMFAKAIVASRPGQRISLEDFVISGQNIILVGKLQDNGTDNILILQTDLDGNLSTNSECVQLTNLDLTTQNLNIVKTESTLDPVSDMTSVDLTYRFLKEPLSNVACAVCQSGDFNIQAEVDSTCFNTCNGRIGLQGADSTAYTYQWGDGRIQANIGGLCAGTYRVTVTQNGTCSKDTTIELSATRPIRLSPETTHTCFDSCHGVLRLNPDGGVGALTYFWNTGARTSNLDALCAGSYAVTITDVKGCILSDTFDVRNNQLDFKPLVEDLDCTPPTSGRLVIEILEGQQPFEVSINGSPFDRIIPMLDVTTGKSYQITLRDFNRCIATRNIITPIVIPINLSLPDLQPIKYGDTVLIVPVIPNDNRQFIYLWTTKNPDNQLNCLDCPQSTVTAVANDSIFLTIKDSIGCVVSASTLLRVIENNQVYIPTAFSPNEDNQNDVFTVFGQQGASTVLLMRIFGRWGELIYESSNFELNDLQKGWDGTFRGMPANQGIYVYVIEMQFRSGRRELFKGNLHLLR